MQFHIAFKSKTLEYAAFWLAIRGIINLKSIQHFIRLACEFQFITEHIIFNIIIKYYKNVHNRTKGHENVHEEHFNPQIIIF